MIWMELGVFDHLARDDQALGDPVGFPPVARCLWGKLPPH
jgi:hypothetical protein